VTSSPASDNLARPTVVREVRLETDPRLTAARIRHHETDSDGLAEETDPVLRERLIRHSPTMLILPEGEPGTYPPSKNGRYDYHPHEVDSFLGSEVRSRPLTPTRWTAVVFIAFLGFYCLVMPAIVLFLITGTEMLFYLPRLVLVPLSVVFVLMSIGVAQFWTQQGPKGVEVARAAVAAGHELSVSTLATDKTPSAEKVWDAYCLDHAKGPNDNGLIYARALEDEGMVVLQYWLFYRYNDWWNQHEADWEVVMVYLTSVDPDATPTAVAYSSHLAGRWRPWLEAERDGDHPIVYVARGSHAQYFAPIEGGYESVLDQAWDFRLLRGQIRVAGSRDYVGTLPDDPDKIVEGSYRLSVMPRDHKALTEADPRWRDWWWLQYRGGWGYPEWIPGPTVQTEKWEHPVRWARLTCVADAGAWEHVAKQG